MGHIVGTDELKNVDKSSNIPLRSSVHLTESSTHQQQQHQGPSISQPSVKTPRRFPCTISSGSNWSECVQSVNSLLPSPYAERWLQCLEQLLHNEGPLPESWRIYIAILALCRHEVTWAVRALTLEFITAEGDRKWLSGLRFAPKKLRALTPINNILAHRPWTLTPQHVLDLTKGDESWSISELCQALCLITHFHSFASFLHACLPLPPPPPPPHSQTPPPSTSSHSNSLPLTPRTSPAKVILPSSLPDTLKHLKNLPLEVSPHSMISTATSDSSQKSSETNTSENNSRKSETSSFSTPTKSPSIDTREVKGCSVVTTTVSTCTSVPISVSQVISKIQEDTSGSKVSAVAVGGAKREIQSSPQPNKQSKNESHSTRSLPCKEETPSSLREFPHLCHDLSFTYEDFSWQASPSIFNIMEFNWQDHGYCLMTRLLNEMSNLIDERFGSLKNISHPAWNKNNEDNSYNYRRAVWNYIQSLYGICHEAYMYSQIDNYLSKEVKNFIKKCCCWPETLEGKIPSELLGNNSTTENTPSQLVPLAILIMEARTESCLLYALRAIIPHQC